MKLLNTLKNAITRFLQGGAQDWWVEITTTEPRCTYYFGPFKDQDEAEIAKPGYLEDLESEGAKQIQSQIKRCQPQVLTIIDEGA